MNRKTPDDRHVPRGGGADLIDVAPTSTDMPGNIVGHPIVVGVDRSASALRAVCWAANEAALRQVPLHPVHSLHFPRSPTSAGLAPTTFLEMLEAQGRRYLAEAEAITRVAHPEVNGEVDQQPEDPIPVLVGLSHTAHLVVLGSRGLGGFRRILVGSTAVALVTHSHCPVAVIRGPASSEAPPTQGPVAVGVDGSPTSEVAIALAFEEASIRNLDLVAVHTWIDFSNDNSDAYAHQSRINWHRIKTEEWELLAPRLAGWPEKYPDVTVQRVVTRNRPVHHLLDQASHAQLLVVGSRGRGGIPGMLLGSTSHAVLHHAPCPVVVVRQSGPL